MPMHGPQSAASALLTLAISVLPAQTTRVLYTATGSNAFDAFGHAVAACGDVDGDGLADVLVGVPNADDLAPDAGLARVLGRGGRVLLTVRGTIAGGHFGAAVAGLGDLDGDGVPDFLVGAPDTDVGGARAGLARVHSGRDGSVLHAFQGLPGDECGYAVAAAGDIDRDGVPDFMVGFHLADTPLVDAGIARVYSGRDGRVLYQKSGPHAAAGFGRALTGCGDVNRDGWDDFMIGAPHHSAFHEGAAYVYSGRDGEQLWSFHGDGGGHELGDAMARCGDVDGDGHADLLVGEPEHRHAGDDGGAVKLFSGRTGALLVTLYGSAPYDYFGLSLGAGDFDADGIPDLVVGVFLADSGRPDGGAIHVYSGADYRRIFVASGTGQEEWLGRSVAFAGDIDGDGIGDVVAGIPKHNVPAPEAGGARAYCGLPARAATFVFGSGCPPAAPFEMHFAGTPREGRPFRIELHKGPTTVPVAWVALALHGHAPLDLTAAGMPGCTLHQPLHILLPVALSGGAGILPLAAPLLGEACGLQLHVQAIGWEPTANPLGVVTSNGGRVVVAR